MNSDKCAKSLRVSSFDSCLGVVAASAGSERLISPSVLSSLLDLWAVHSAFLDLRGLF